MSGRPVLGIDLGTTYSCVARLDSYGRPEILPNLDGELTTPSVVYFENDASVVVGEAAKNELLREPDRVIDLIKRYMGSDDYRLVIDDESYLPQRVSAIILRSLVEGALTAAGEPVPAQDQIADVVITVPAYFGAAERQATRDAGQMAGLNVLNIINEPTAAAIAYGATSAGVTANVLVYDLGGGTFDVTVIQVSAEEVRVVATDGDHALGGANWDAMLQDLLAEKYLAVHPDRGDPRTDDSAVGELSLLAEAAKRDLSRKEKYRTSVTAHGERAPVEVTRAEYEDLTAGLIERTIDFTRSIIEKAAEKNIDRFDAVLLVGGMSRSPAVARRLGEAFGQLPAAQLTDPDLIVAKGAALFAARSVLETEYDPSASSGLDEQGEAGPRLDPRPFFPGPVPRIINVSSKGYGIRAVDGPDDRVGHVEWLIQPNDPIPCSPQESFRTVHAGQTAVDISVFESPTTDLDDEIEANKLLIEGTLEGLSADQPAGQPLNVDFELGDDGILHVRARSENGKELTLEARISGATPAADLFKPLPSIQH